MENNRIQLRPWLESDAGVLYKYASDPEVGPRAGWPPHKSVEESLEIIRTVFNDASYREFYQCDVDAIGSRSLLNELELVQIVDEVFGKLGIRVCLKINNRKILAGLAEVCGAPDKLIDITVAIDKIDKIGLDAVKEELRYPLPSHPTWSGASPRSARGFPG